jgi:hypothetical protein
MLIREVSDPRQANNAKLLALTQFLTGRAEDTNSQKQISTDAFVKMAQSLGVSINPAQIGDLIARPPLSNVLEPYQPNSGVVRFKGNMAADADMNTDQAEEVVNKNAKAALKRR